MKTTITITLMIILTPTPIITITITSMEIIKLLALLNVLSILIV